EPDPVDGVGPDADHRDGQGVLVDQGGQAAAPVGGEQLGGGQPLDGGVPGQGHGGGGQRAGGGGGGSGLRSLGAASPWMGEFRGRITAAATSGPARAPRPASSTPATRPKQAARGRASNSGVAVANIGRSLTAGGVSGRAGASRCG